MGLLVVFAPRWTFSAVSRALRRARGLFLHVGGVLLCVRLCYAKKCRTLGWVSHAIVAIVAWCACPSRCALVLCLSVCLWWFCVVVLCLAFLVVCLSLLCTSLGMSYFSSPQRSGCPLCVHPLCVRGGHALFLPCSNPSVCSTFRVIRSALVVRGWVWVGLWLPSGQSHLHMSEHNDFLVCNSCVCGKD